MKLKEYIDKHDTKINALARRCGVSAGTLGFILNGRDMKLSIAAKIVAGTYGHVTFDDLVDGIDSPAPKAKPKKKA